MIDRITIEDGEKKIAALTHNAKRAMQAEGYTVEHIKLNPEGNSHYGFDVVIAGIGPAFARFEKSRELATVDSARRDYHFNGLLSLDREAATSEVVRKAGLPAPKLHGVYDNDHGTFMLVERMPGVLWGEHLKENNHSAQVYLGSITFLGEDLAKLHMMEFDSYGDVMGENHILPPNIHDFTDRISFVVNLNLERAALSEALTADSLVDIQNYFNTELAALSQLQSKISQTPVLSLFDWHARNHFVNESGKPTGYFDLEAVQAALPVLDFTFIQLGILNHYHNTANEAGVKFLEAYRGAGGVYDPNEPINVKIRAILTASHLLTTTIGYYGKRDGIRDNWSPQAKVLLFNALSGDDFDYLRIGDITRTKTQHPKTATRP